MIQVKKMGLRAGVFSFSVTFAVLFCGAFIASTGSSLAAEKVAIGVLTDGPADGFDKIKELFVEELVALTRGEFELEFPKSAELDGDWSIEKIAASFDSLQKNPDVDMVLAMGFVSSLVVARSEHPVKPTFAPLVLNSNLFNLPRSDGTSGVRNLNYLTEDIRFADDVLTFREIVPFQSLAMIVDSTIFESVPELAAEGRRWARELGIELTYVVNSEENEDVVAKIPDHVQAVMVAAVPRLNASARQQLIYHLNAENLPSYSLIGTTPVEKGMLAATALDSDWKRLARKNALNMQSVLLGDNAGDLPVIFKHKRQLTINMETARKIGVYPRFDVLSSAQLLSEENYPEEVEWTLSSVAHEALRSNLEIQSSIAGINATGEDVNQARALLMPQFDSSLGVTELDSNGVAVQSGSASDTTTSAGISGSQIIYSESTRAGVDIQERLQQSRLSGHRIVELDIIQQATLAFLNFLKAQTFVDIRKSSLNLSRSNLDLARDRVELGSVTAADVYRWESEVATDRQNLLAARAQYKQARDALNQLLRRPIDENFQTSPASLKDDSLMISRKDLTDIIDNSRSFDLMGDFMVIRGKQSSPELQQLNYQIAAIERELLSDRKSYWSPDVNLTGKIDYIIDESPQLANSREDESDWQVRISLSLPLFEGGARKSRISQSEYEIHQLNLNRMSTEDLIELQIRRNLHAVEASYPSIELAQQAAVSSAKNLALIQDNYSAGNISIIELIDARDESLSAEQNATNAVYDFLIDLMNLQRTTAEFDFFLDPQEIQRTIEQIRYYISTPQ
jgi:outer membrane protein TolC/ABC-type uncharacterized transport system substrate-binding protein